MPSLSESEKSLAHNSHLVCSVLPDCVLESYILITLSLVRPNSLESISMSLYLPDMSYGKLAFDFSLFTASVEFSATILCLYCKQLIAGLLKHQLGKPDVDSIKSFVEYAQNIQKDLDSKTESEFLKSKI